MKKLICLIVLSAWLENLCLAQKTALEKEDTLATSKKPASRDKLIFDLTHDNWQKVPSAIATSFLSRGVTISGMNDIVFGKGPFGFAFGLGFSSHNVFSNGAFEETAATDSTLSYTRFAPLTAEYKKNKLSVNYIEIPFEIRFRTRGKKPFRIYAGFKGGYLVNIHTKIIDGKGKRKYFTFNNANPYRYGITSRVGYGNFALTGFYGLSTLFKEGKGDELVPYSIGISFSY